MMIGGLTEFKDEKENLAAAGRTRKWPLKQVGRIRDKRGGRSKNKMRNRLSKEEITCRTHKTA